MGSLCQRRTGEVVERTDSDGLDLDALLDVGRVGVIRVLVLEDLLSAERVHEGGPACAAWSARCHQAQWRARHVPVPEAPQTIRQNWMPFLTFFFLRVLSICRAVSARAQWPERCRRGGCGDAASLRGGLRIGASYRGHGGRRTVRVMRVMRRDERRLHEIDGRQTGGIGVSGRGDGGLIATVLRCRREIWDVANSSWLCKGAR